MSWIRQLRIGTRLGLAFGAMLVLVGLIGGVGLLEASRINQGANELGTNWLPSVKALAEIDALLSKQRRFALDHVLEVDMTGKQMQEARRSEVLTRELPQALTTYAALISSPEEQALFDTFRSQLKASETSDTRMLALSKASEDAEQARKLAVGESAELYQAASDTLGKAMKLNTDGGLAEADTAAARYQQAITMTVGLLALALAAGAGLAVLITRSITQPLQRTVNLAEQVTNGDLTQRLTVEAQDEPAQLAQALNRMSEKLAGIVSEVRQSSDSIATGSAEIATGNADLSQRTEEQAANLEETAASMEQLNSTVKASADTARQAAQLATAACASAARGGEVVGQVVSTMDEITASSRKIGEIIGTIDGIAFQTNILALNAAVEAARAGEQGRGFAVVAGEVRTLAQRSAEAAREIKSLIGASMDRVEAGSRLVGDAGSQMTDIVGQVRRVADLISEISAAAVEQTAGIGQVNDAVGQLDQVTQQNAALVEQSAAAAESLKQQAQRLLTVIGAFNSGASTSHNSAWAGGSHHGAVAHQVIAKAKATSGGGHAAAPASKSEAATPAAAASTYTPTASATPKTPSHDSGASQDWESF